ncbi:hypothetical protein [Streptomyces sp. NPDC056244]|uniref:hypothetical protein n=1 Tax=Streptomyces sp. NPDC056244 TaxID=3345762 RepID=UPI0035DF3B50
MGSRADDEGSDVEIYREALSGTIRADTPTGAPETLLALLDHLGLERTTVTTGGPVRRWHEVPARLGEDEKKRLATRVVPTLLMAGYVVNIADGLFDPDAYRQAAHEMRAARAAPGRPSSAAPAAPADPAAPATTSYPSARSSGRTMPDPTPYAVMLADDIARRLGQLSEHLSQAPPQQAAQILSKVIDADEGVLGRVTALLVTGSRVAQHQAQAGSLPPEAGLALGRAANKLHDIALDLDEHAEAIQRLADPPAVTYTAAARPAASGIAAGRRR